MMWAKVDILHQALITLTTLLIVNGIQFQTFNLRVWNLRISTLLLLRSDMNNLSNIIGINTAGLLAL